MTRARGGGSPKPKGESRRKARSAVGGSASAAHDNAAPKRKRGRPPSRESAAARQEFGDARVIRRYGNRRLYDSRESRSVTLDEIGEFVRRGEDVRVIDERGADITRRVLTQIILEESNRHRLELLPVELLRKIISLRDDSLTSWLEQYLTAGAAWLERQVGAAKQAVPSGVPGAQQVRESFDALLRGGAGGAWPWSFAGAPGGPSAPRTGYPDPSPPPSEGEKGAGDETVHDEIDELQRRLADLAARVKRR